MEMGETNNPIIAMAFKSDRCFLCGKNLASDSTREHVFPKWLLKHGLMNDSLELLNLTTIKYGELTIPCCASCNNTFLSELEKEISCAFESGYEAVCGLEPIRLFQWLAKMFYGILYKEATLKIDRTGSTEGTIIEWDCLEEFRELHMLLQSIRLSFEFTPVEPWSIIVTRVAKFDNIALDFDYKDSFSSPVVALRVNGIGVIANLLDNELQYRYNKELWDEIEQVELEPIQWDEIVAEFFDQAERMLWHPSKVFMNSLDFSNEDKVIVCVGTPTEGTKLFQDIDCELLARRKLTYWRKYVPELTLADIYMPPNKVCTYLRKPDGSIRRFDSQ